MGDPMAEQDWTTPEYLGNITAEELGKAIDQLGIGIRGCWSDDDGARINVAFHSIRDAETMVSLGVLAEQRPGTLYDRAAASCVTLAEFANRSEVPTDAGFEAIMNASWHWIIHPDMNGRRMGWHVSVDIPSADAQQLTANLNAVRLAVGGGE